MLSKFLRDESGATAIEYGLIAALLSVSLLAGYKVIGESLDNHWGEVASAVTTAGGDYIN